MMRNLIALICLVLVVAGCEGIFGKETGERGALPGKRSDVFSEESSLKPSTEEGATTIDVPEEQDSASWTMPGGSLEKLKGNAALSATPHESWSVSIGSGTNQDGSLMATPVIEGERIYTVDSSGSVSALSVTHGDRLWQKNVPEQVPENASIFGTGLALGEGKLVVATSYGFVVALDPATGKQYWQRNLLTPLRSAPIIHEGKIYIITMTNTLQQLSLADGTLGWNHAGIVETASFLGMASPAIADDLVIAPYSSGEVFGLRALNGRMVWEENLGGSKRTGTLPSMADIQAQPILHNGRLYVASNSGRFVALDVRTGRRVWEADAGSTSTPWIAGNTIYMLTTDSQLAALALDTGRVRWVRDVQRYADMEDKSRQISWVGPVLAGGQLWLANSLGEIKTFAPQDGKDRSVFSAGAPVYLSPVVAGRTLYFLTDAGTLLAFK